MGATANDDYEQCFHAAIARTNSHGLDCPVFSAGSAPLLTGDGMSELSKYLVKQQGGLKLSDVSSRCVDANITVKPYVEKFFGVTVYVTSGAVRQEPTSPFFELSESDIHALLVNPIQRQRLQPIPFHAWLTFPTMEILDITLGTSIGVRFNVQKMLGQVYGGYPAALPLVWHPMMVGEEFLRKSGAV